jgi:hypothetical protein
MWGAVVVDSKDVCAGCDASVEVGRLWVGLLLVVARGEDGGGAALMRAARTCAGEDSGGWK